MKLFMRHEQLVWNISVTTPLKRTDVVVPSLVWPCLVASNVQGRPGSLSKGNDKTVPLFRPFGNVYVAEAPEAPVKVSVVAAARVAPVYWTRNATIPLLHSRTSGGG